MIETGVTVLLTFLTLSSALRTAVLWWKASKALPRLITHIAGSQGHVIQLEDEAAAAALLNAQAALWSGATAVLSAVTAVWGVLAPLR